MGQLVHSKRKKPRRLAAVQSWFPAGLIEIIGPSSYPSTPISYSSWLSGGLAFRKRSLLSEPQQGFPDFDSLHSFFFLAIFLDHFVSPNDVSQEVLAWLSSLKPAKRKKRNGHHPQEFYK